MLGHANLGKDMGTNVWSQGHDFPVDPDHLYLNRAGVHPLKTHLNSNCNP
jgi:hypothetical protein